MRTHETTGDAIQLYRGTFGERAVEFVDVWCRDLAPRTRADLRYCFGNYVPRALQAVRLSAITGTMLQQWVNDLSSRGLAARTCAKALAEVRRCLSVAVEHGKLSRNPAEYVKPPKAVRVQRARYTREQVTALLEAVEGNPLEAFFTLAVLAALRPGELLALTWSDIVHEEVVVQGSLTKNDDGALVRGPTKTGRARRIPLGQAEQRALARHRRVQAEHRLKLGARYCDQDLVFANETGGPLEPRNVTNRHFKPILKRASLPNIRLYDLRHSCLSMLADEGIDPKIIQERAGHTSIKTTYDHYIHAHPDGQSKATALLNRLVAAG